MVHDAVVNHTAPEHLWLKGRPDWYNGHVETPEKGWPWGLPDLAWHWLQEGRGLVNELETDGSSEIKAGAIRVGVGARAGAAG